MNTSERKPAPKESLWEKSAALCGLVRFAIIPIAIGIDLLPSAGSYRVDTSFYFPDTYFGICLDMVSIWKNKLTG